MDAFDRLGFPKEVDPYSDFTFGRYDGKHVFKLNGTKVILLNRCPAAKLSLQVTACGDQILLNCPYRREEYHEGYEYSMVYGCPHMVDGSYCCYTTQDLDKYLEQKGAKEFMEKNGIKDARRMPDGVMIAVDDVVEVSLGYVNNSLYEKLTSKTFVARIVRFETNYIVLDMSTQFNAKVIEVKYDDLCKISLVRPEEKADANSN